MASIRITQFAGLMPELSAKLKRKDNAQIAHNCLLYDGKLRAMPAYFQYTDAGEVPVSMYRASQNGAGKVVPDFDLIDAVCFENPPFPQATLGICPTNPYAANNFVGAKYGPPGITGGVLSAGVDPPIVVGSPALTIAYPGNLTLRPETVSYAMTAARYFPFNNQLEESAPILLGVIGDGVVTPLWHQGDAVNIAVNVQPFNCGQTYVNLYRSITALESGEQLVNTFDTDWYLLATIPAPRGGGLITYTDVSTTDRLLGTLLPSKTFFSPFYNVEPRHFGLTESGWVWFATANEVQFSERFKVHAWPIANYLQLPLVDTVIDATTFYDTVYLGTDGRPYKVTIDTSDNESMQVKAFPYPEHQPCISNTLVTAPFGALYTSVNGVVSLDDSRMQVITKDLLNGGDSLYEYCDTTGDTPVKVKFHFADITTAAWFNGWYIGYAPSGKIFIYQAPEDLNDAHPFQQLVTMDAPVNAAPGPWALGDFGLQIAFGTALYYWPVPGWVRTNDTVTKLCYRWKSKKFVMPGGTAFAAAKVVWECDGEVCFKLFIDCMCAYETKVTDCKPFRLPMSLYGVEYEVELTGTGTVSEVHVASSMRDLTEVENE